MRTFLLIAIATGLQVSPPSTPKPVPKDPTVQVRGCLHGRILTVTDDNPGFDFPARSFALTGDKAVMRAIKEHSDHEEEVVGLLKAQRTDSAAATKEKRGEKTRVYVGVSTKTSTSTDAPLEMPTIRVQALRHINSKCP